MSNNNTPKTLSELLIELLASAVGAEASSASGSESPIELPLPNPDPEFCMKRIMGGVKYTCDHLASATGCKIVVCSFEEVVHSTDERFPVGTKTSYAQKKHMLTVPELDEGKTICPFDHKEGAAFADSTIIFGGIPRGAVIVTHAPHGIKANELALTIERTISVCMLKHMEMVDFMNENILPIMKDRLKELCKE